MTDRAVVIYATQSTADIFVVIGPASVRDRIAVRVQQQDTAYLVSDISRYTDGQECFTSGVELQRMAKVLTTRLRRGQYHIDTRLVNALDVLEDLGDHLAVTQLVLAVGRSFVAVLTPYLPGFVAFLLDALTAFRFQRWRAQDAFHSSGALGSLDFRNTQSHHVIGHYKRKFVGFVVRTFSLDGMVLKHVLLINAFFRRFEGDITEVFFTAQRDGKDPFRPEPTVYELGIKTRDCLERFVR